MRRGEGNETLAGVCSWPEGETVEQKIATEHCCVVLGTLFEFQVPLELVGAKMGDRLQLRFSLWRENLPVDALPVEGWLVLHVSSDADLEENVYNYSADN